MTVFVIRTFNKIKSVFANRKRNILVISQVINASFGVLTGKLIAVFLSPEDFGLFNLQFAAYTFFFSLFIEPITRFVKASYNGFINKIGFNYFGITLLVSNFFAFIFLGISFLFYGWSGSNIYLMMLLLITFPLNTIYKIVSDYFNVHNLIWEFSITSILKGFFGVLLLTLLFGIFNTDIEGFVALWIVQAGGWLLGIGWYFNKIQIVFKSNVISIKNFLRRQGIYIWPLMVVALWSWLNNYFDRYVIDKFLGLSEVGIYHANYSLGSKFFLLINPIFLVMLTPYIYKNYTLSLKKKRVYEFSKTYLVLGGLALIPIYFLTDLLGLALLSASYSGGFFLIFWTALGYLVITATYLFETIFYSENRTKIILYSNMVSAIVNVSLAIILIPLFGLWGAILSKVIGALARFVMVFNRFLKL